MRKIIIGLLIIAALATAVYYSAKYYEKYSDLDMLTYDIDTVKLNVPFSSAADVPAALGEFASLSVPVDINFLFQNHSDSSFTVNAVYLEIYTIDGTLLAYQDAIKENFVIEPKKNNIELFSFNLYLTALANLGKSYSPKLLDGIIKLFSTYVTTKKFGVKIQLKGWVKAEGIKVLKVPVNKIIDI